MAASLKEIKPYNPNENAPAGAAEWPIIDHVYSVEDYASFFMQTAPSYLETFAKSLTSEIRKGTPLPPDMQSFATFSLMP
jgi:hypothetical protein